MNKKIHWERVDKNTYKDDKFDNDSNNLEDDIQPEDQGNGIFDLSSLESGLIDHSFFGMHHKESPLNPFNVYGYDYMYLGHMVGFNANSACFYKKTKTKLHQVLDLVEGISVWRIIDTHKFLFIPAKHYDPEFVMDEIERAFGIPSKQDTQPENKLQSVDIMEKCLEISRKYQVENVDHFVMLKPNNEIIHFNQTHPDFNRLIADAKEVNRYTNNCHLIINGEIFE